MKPFHLPLLAVMLFTASTYAQSPQGFTYQAVVRDGSGDLVISSSVGVRISILDAVGPDNAVYVETHSTTTNANGLVTIRVGGGTPVSGTFSTINWGSSLYYVKSETDPAGGTNYTVSGIQQLMSVPYALYAKTAETLTGGITEADPVFGASIASGITGTDTTNWNDKQDQLIAGDNISIVGNTISASGGPTLAIGQSYQGGIIFWLDATGQHGLISATTDTYVGLGWSNGANRYVGVTGDGLYAGAMNTAIIVGALIADHQNETFAAKVCADHSVVDGGVTYGDWYLPSLYELGLLYAQRDVVGGFTNGYYWSSNESSTLGGEAWAMIFNVGFAQTWEKNYTHYARAIRAF